MSLRRRVVLCTYPSVYSEVVLHELLKSPAIELVGVFSSTRVLNKSDPRLRASIRQIQLSGIRYATYLFVITGLYTGLRWLFRKPSFKQQLVAKKIARLETDDINSAESLDFLNNLQPDVLLSAHFNQLLKPEVLALPNLACVNIHPSLLPAFKGVDPAFYALLRQARETGATVHLQNEQFDQGAILEQSKLSIRPTDTLFSLNLKLFKLGALAAVRQITILTADTIGVPQTSQGRYDSWPNPLDTKQFRQQRRYFRWREYLAFIRYSQTSAS
ncbi:formyltransferase family protein [uncultured Thiothrix sp.]|mgnify:CR=1 FL=1|uniref:formyltransferase family protein n=1 Tax=uncultured Thiothrix sp. TaxID=223185 RepID=UPI002611480A|nr:formyltransferase family protein [uncultured Thiothrix sp.]